MCLWVILKPTHPPRMYLQDLSLLSALAQTVLASTWLSKKIYSVEGGAQLTLQDFNHSVACFSADNNLDGKYCQEGLSWRIPGENVTTTFMWPPRLTRANLINTNSLRCWPFQARSHIPMTKQELEHQCQPYFQYIQAFTPYSLGSLRIK